MGKELPVHTGYEAEWVSETVWTFRTRQKPLASADMQAVFYNPQPSRYTD